MRQRWSALLLAVALLVAAMAAGAEGARKERKEKDKKKAHRGTAAAAEKQKNLCDIQEEGVNVYCYCKNQQDIDNATEATCWVFNGEKEASDPVWAYFASQRSLEMLKFNVRPDGRLRALPAHALAHLQKLKVLDVQYATLANLPPYAFANLSSLSEVTMSRNQIVSLSPRSFAHLPELEQLNLDENRIAELKRDVFVLPSLRRLYLDRNNLSVVADGAFKHLPRLEELELSGNQLSVVTKDTFTGLKNLKRLDLQANRLTMLGDGAFSELQSLEELELDENELQLLSERCLQGLSRLQRLSLSSNKLRTLPSDLLVPARSRLRALDLRDNQLTTLPEAVARPLLPALRDAAAHAALHLDENNFVCDCRLKWMYALKNETGNEQVRYALEELTCILNEPLLYDGSSTHGYEFGTEEPDFVRDAPAKGVVEQPDDQYDDDDDSATALPDSRRHLFDIPPSLLPCPEELSTKTRSNNAAIDPDDYFGTKINAAMSGSSAIFSSAAILTIAVTVALVAPVT